MPAATAEPQGAEVPWTLPGVQGGSGPARAPSREADPEQIFQAETREFLRERTRQLAGAGVVIYLMFWVLDYWAHPEYAWEFLMIRLVVGGVCLATYGLATNPAATRYAFPLSIGFVVASSASVSIMASMLGGFVSDYYVGNIVVLFAAASFMPWSFRQAFFYGVLHVGTYVGILLLNHSLSLAAVAPISFSLGTAALAVAAAVVGESSRRREHNQRMVIAAANADLRALDRAKNQFFANLSHEFRTPVTLMLAPIEAIIEEPEMLPEVRSEQLDLCRRNALRLLRLVDDLLTLSRLEAGRFRLRVDPCDLWGTVTELVRQVQPLASRKEIEVLVEPPQGDADLGWIVEADGAQIERVLLNLLANGIKFTPPGGRVSCSLTADDRGVGVVVTDTGSGIPSDELPRIFERFHQVDGSSTRRHGGTGIGLALAKEIVALHGGTIEARSVEGEGTQIRCWWPRTCAVPSSARERRGPGNPLTSVERRSAGGLPEWHEQLRSRSEYRLMDVSDVSERRVLPRTTSDGRKPRLLVVEDNADMVRLIASLLSADYEVVAASDGAAGLRLAIEMGPDLILSDVMMPEMTGFELLEALRSDARTAHLPVCLLTAKGEVDSRIEGRVRGADAHLAKPFQPSELRATLAGLVTSQTRHVESAQGDRDAAIKQLAAGMAHEILNPLGFISGALGGIRDVVQEWSDQDGAPSDPEVRAGLEEMVESAVEGVRRIQAITTELQRLSKGGEPAPSVCSCPNEIVRRVTTLAGVHVVEVDGDGEPPSRGSGGEPNGQIVFADLRSARKVPMRPGQIEQVVLNLLINGFHASGPSGRITIRTWDTEPTDDPAAGVVITVSDNGQGIEPEAMEAIFDPFFTTKAPGEGTGLGLALGRQIVRAHGGTLTAHSDPGCGATFTLRLPGEGIAAGSQG